MTLSLLEAPSCEGVRRPATLQIYELHPLQDPRWAELTKWHPRASVFHTVAWLEALRRTYGYEPVAYTTSPPGRRLQDGLVFCRVASWATGRRLVSLPFSDHCEPLLAASANERAFLRALEQKLREQRLRYFEIRASHGFDNATSLFSSDHVYALHELDLAPDESTLFHNCHKSSTQRKILRAQREGLLYQEGRSESLLDAFWKLHLLTRRRHGVPPQPQQWFRSLIPCFGEALKIRVAFKRDRALAAIVTIRHGTRMVFKYGSSDALFNNLGGTHLLFWRSILEAKRDGLSAFDFGRSDLSNTGLITFKDRWGSTRSTVTYRRFGASRFRATAGLAATRTFLPASKLLFTRLPDSLLCFFSDVVYRHIG